MSKSLVFKFILVLFLLQSSSGCSYLVKDYYRVTLLDIPSNESKVNSNIKLRDLIVGIQGVKSQKAIELLDVLQKSKLFADVNFVDELKTKPDLLVVSSQDSLVDGFNIIIDMFTHIEDVMGVYWSFGILPTRPNIQESNASFYLESTDNQRKVLIPFKYRVTRMTGGWPFMTPLILIQQWYLDENKAYAKGIKKAILLKTNEIASLVHK